jgi:hypothetical protein
MLQEMGQSWVLCRLIPRTSENVEGSLSTLLLLVVDDQHLQLVIELDVTVLLGIDVGLADMVGLDLRVIDKRAGVGNS